MNANITPPDRSGPRGGFTRRRSLATATCVVGLGVLLGGAPLDARNRTPGAAMGVGAGASADPAAVVRLVTERVPAACADDRGSLMTYGTGVAPVLSDTEMEILAAARAAVAEAEARNDGSVSDDARRGSAADIEREKLNRLAAQPAPTLETIQAFPDAGARR